HHGVARVVETADLGVRVDERAPAPVVLGPLLGDLQRGEHALGSRARASGDTGRELRGEPVDPPLAPAPQVRGDEVVLGTEPVVERLLGHAGLVGDAVDADAADPTLVEQLARGGEDALARRRAGVGGASRHGGLLSVHCEYTDLYGYVEG